MTITSKNFGKMAKGYPCGNLRQQTSQAEETYRVLVCGSSEKDISIDRIAAFRKLDKEGRIDSNALMKAMIGVERTEEEQANLNLAKQAIVAREGSSK